MSESSENARERTGSLSPRPRRRRGCLTAVLLLAVFLFGVVCGMGGALLIVVRGVRQNIQHPERRPYRTAERLARRLDLTETQKTRVLAILKEQQREFMALRRRVAPDVVKRLRETDRRIGEVLTPEQRVKWRAMVDRLKRNWLPPELEEQMNAPRPADTRREAD